MRCGKGKPKLSNHKIEFGGFSDFPIVDSHVHFVHPERLEEMAALLKETGSRRVNLVCIPNPDATTHNAAALYYKKRYPESTFISGALNYRIDLTDLSQAGYSLAQQILKLKNQGFDGLKLIEGKPQVRKLLDHRLDGPLYRQMWRTLEEQQFPIVLHIADPDEFWDAEACPDWARQSGWDYSADGFPSKEKFYDEVKYILERHPKLKLILAHFAFLSKDLKRAGKFLDSHPSVYFDLAPHLGMYQDFSVNPTATRDFFVRYQDRILYGTDLDTRTLTRGDEGRGFLRFSAWLIRSFLEKEGRIELKNGSYVQGLGLSEDVLVKIYTHNFESIYGNQSRPLPDE